MKKMLITGGTVFVSRFAAEYYRNNYDVFVLNRNTRPQCAGVTLLEGDRHALGNLLREMYFDVILDVTAYHAADVTCLLDAVGGFGDYVLISSSAVYPEHAQQPFREEAVTGPNKFWGKYGTDKIAGEEILRYRVPHAYILRPPYLYGPGNNVYREAFVFECAQQGRPFYLPGEGDMELQFFHVRDLCRFIDRLLSVHPGQRVFNVGNPTPISIKDWVTLCYKATGNVPEFRNVWEDIEQRNYFPFYNYEYRLDVSGQLALMPGTGSMETGLQQCYAWYSGSSDAVIRKPLIDYIDQNLRDLP